MSSIATSDRPHVLSSLPLRPQLFLWTIRHLILAVGNQRPVCRHVQKTFEIANVPMLPFLVEELLHVIAQHANRRLEFSHPSSTRLLPDEQGFLACLQALMQRPAECGCKHLSDMVEPDSLDKVMPRFALVAATLQQCQPSATGGPCDWSAESPLNQAISAPGGSATLH